MKKKPTEKELADACGLSLEAWKQVKDMPLDKLSAVAALFGCTVGIQLVLRGKKK